MGMCINGKNPRSDIGKNISFSIGWWHGLWSFCCEHSKDIIDEKTADLGNVNDGAGLDDEESILLASVLQDVLDTGKAKSGKLPGNKYYTGIIEGLRRGGINIKVDTTTVPFDVQDLIDFIAFLKDCGGFEIV